jgi:phytoene dehydrogenase-like protein
MRVADTIDKRSHPRGGTTVFGSAGVLAGPDDVRNLLDVPLDAVVVGSGPNGLAAAITLARAGRSVLVLEAEDFVGGGLGSAELTLPGYVHDVCSAIHPLASASPFFADLGLDQHGLQLVHPEIALAHPLDGGRAGVLHRSLDETIAALGADGAAWRRSVGWVSDRWDLLAPSVFAPLLRMPRHPVALGHFGLQALLPATVTARRYASDEAKALFAGASAHAFLPLNRPLTTSFGLMLLAAGHVAGWPAAKGGSASIADAMVSLLKEHGGAVESGRPVRSLRDVPPCKAVLFDLAPRHVVDICGDELPHRYRSRLQRFRHGPGVCKVDYALSEPVPWTNDACRRAGTVHVGGTIAQVAAAEADVAAGRHPDAPFVLIAQQSLFDDTRAPEGRHTLWTYCHVPNGSDVDMTAPIERQLERFAPGFRDIVLARHVANSSWYEHHNANYVGGDIAGGSHGGLQLVFRPSVSLVPYRTPNPKFFICSASTPPGGGVHGMCGLHAANAALDGPLR